VDGCCCCCCGRCTGTELAVLSGHPEEVYAVHFLPDAPVGSSTQQQQVQHATDQLASSTLDSPPAAAAAAQPSSNRSSGSSSLLLTASGESLYLWDLAAGQMLQQSAPLPVLRTSPAFSAAVAGSSQQQQQQGPRSGAVSAKPSSRAVAAAAAAVNGTSARASSDEDSSEESDGGFDEPPPSYIFGVSVCAETLWAAATCSDGMLRLWDASRRALTEVAAVQVGWTSCLTVWWVWGKSGG
jgi:hypothetical protein